VNEAETVKQVKESFHQMVGLLSEAIPVIESKIVDNLSQIRTEKNAIISAWIEILKQNKQTLVRDKQITDILTQWQNNTQKDKRYFRLIYTALEEHIRKIRQATDTWHELSREKTILYEFRPLNNLYDKITMALKRVNYFNYHLMTIQQEELFVDRVMKGKRSFFILKKDLMLNEISREFDELNSRYTTEQTIIQEDIRRIKKELSEIQSDLTNIEKKILEWLKTQPLTNEEKKDIIDDFDSARRSQTDSWNDMMTIILGNSFH
jgi:hypothetical protein